MFSAQINRYLQTLRLPELKIEVTPLMNKDSLEMTAEDREMISGCSAGACGGGPPVVITHGTDTMVETGKLLKGKISRLRHPIVLTGAMGAAGV